MPAAIDLDVVEGVNGRPDDAFQNYLLGLVTLRDQIDQRYLAPGFLPPSGHIHALQEAGNALMVLQPPPGGVAPPKENWMKLNEAELRLFSVMPDDLVLAELPAQFLRAERIGVPETALLKAQYETAVAKPDFDACRTIGTALLRRMYIRYADRRVDRSMRKVVDQRMVDFAKWILGVFLATVFVLLLLGRFGFGCTETDAFIAFAAFNGATPPMLAETPMTGLTCLVSFHWLVVAFFGMIGAFFSRFLEYRNTRITLSWEDLFAGYASPVIVGRLAVGAFGALLFYFVMGGNLLGGQLFLQPDFNLWQVAADGASRPTEDFFRLLVWSAIAGFSERLVPDRFDEFVNGVTVRS